MKKPSDSEKNWDDLRQQIIGLGEGSHSKNYYPALKQSREALIRFRGVIEEIPDMILITDNQGNILDLNRAAEKVFSRSREELLSLNGDRLLGGKFEALKSENESSEKGSINKIINTEEAGGETVYRELEVRPVRVAQRFLWVVIGRDVSHRIRAEQNLLEMNENLEDLIRERTASIRDTQDQLIRVEKMAVLGTLVAGVAHEINNPLGIGVTASSALISTVEKLKKTLADGTLTEKDFSEFLDYLSESSSLIQRNLERAGELVKSFKQVSVDQSSEQIRTICFPDYLEEVVQSLYPQWKKHSVQVRGDELIKIDTVPGDWSQVITNLIINSVSHGFKNKKTGAVISIHVQKVGEELVLEYRDNGCGLSDEQKERIFDPFYTTARDSGGTGLGMHIVYNIVTLKMGGHIQCINRDEPGAAFIIRVPL